jgi:4-hydroxybenzoate polyprenyltransferase
MLSALIKTMRPRQWTKNGFVLIALVFDKQLLQFEPFWHTALGFVVFCLISSSVYILNDIVDIEVDRQHPQKRLRPIPSGKLPLWAAWSAAGAIIAGMVPLAFWLAPAFGVVIVSYLAINFAYSLWLKHIPILDVLIIAFGFVLRVHGGVTLIEVERFSPWLYVITIMLALYLGFGKRRSELALLDLEANSHRKVFDGYTIPLLDQYILIVSSMTIVAYTIYTFSAPNLPENHSMMLTIPFVIYGIFRYLYLVQVEHTGGAPEEILLSDRPLQAAIMLCVLVVLGVFYLS